MHRVSALIIKVSKCNPIENNTKIKSKLSWVELAYTEMESQEKGKIAFQRPMFFI